MSNPQNNPPLSNTPPERQPSSEPPSIDHLDQLSQRPTRETLAINVLPPLDTTPPLYDNPPSTNNVLLAAVRMQFDKEPNFFNTRLPDRLDGKIPYNLYLARMTELNQHLNTKASLDSIKHLTRLRVIWLVLLAVTLVTALVIDLVTTEVYGYALLVIPVIYGIWVPMTAQYVTIVEGFAKKWSDEDAAQGINLIYRHHSVRSQQQQSRTDVVLLIYERRVPGEPLVTEELPMYSPV